MASKLIVNEIEHTDGAGTAVTVANLGMTGGTIASGVTGTLGSGVTGGAGLTGSTSLGTVTVGTYNATIGSSATFPEDMIIQEKYNEMTPGVGHIRPNGTEVTVLSQAFEPISSSSVIMVTFGGTQHNSWGSPASTFYFYLRDGSLSGSVMHTEGSTYSSRFIWPALNVDIYCPFISTIKLDSWSGNKTIYLTANASDNNTIMLSNSRCFIRLQEVSV